MGYTASISVDRFPKQSVYLGRRTKVLFRDSNTELQGTIVRDDMEYPSRTIIRIDDGRHVLSTECLYAPDEVG